MTVFHKVLAQAISLLKERAKMVKGEDEQLESFPWVSFECEAKCFSGSFSECDAKKLVLNTYDEDERRATKHDYPLSDYFRGAGVVVSVKLWMNAWQSRGGYFGETREEYCGEPDSIGRTVAELRMERDSTDDWTIVE